MYCDFWPKGSKIEQQTGSLCSRLYGKQESHQGQVALENFILLQDMSAVVCQSCISLPAKHLKDTIYRQVIEEMYTKWNFLENTNHFCEIQMTFVLLNNRLIIIQTKNQNDQIFKAKKKDGNSNFKNCQSYETAPDHK